MGYKVDPLSSYASIGKIHKDYICLLNQTNISHNNNKFYKIQLIDTGSGYVVFINYGRVGDAGQVREYPFGDEKKAIAEFKKKFKSKTSNDWDKRKNFTPKARKYDLVDVDTEDDDLDEIEAALTNVGEQSTSLKKKKVLPCTLDERSQSLLKLIFDKDMFKSQMATFDLDVKKMPLGKLSNAQIQKGNDVLTEIEEAISEGSSTSELSSRFYTVIPHSFGRRRPPIISTEELVQKKRDMLAVLGDIVIAQDMKKEQESIAETQSVEEHPLDLQYKSLGCKVTPIDKKSDMFKYIQQYVKATGTEKIIDVYELDRNGEGERFSKHEDLKHRKLLWHGTNVAVVCAILKSGLRIMPHSGGRVGRGIYCASEMSKSEGYTSGSNGVACMFLAEVALGKIHSITRDDSSLRAAPKGYHSIVAEGNTEPDETKNVVTKIGKHDVIIPQGKPLSRPAYSNSYFSQSEYLVYKESQVRLRYLIKIKRSNGWW